MKITPFFTLILTGLLMVMIVNIMPVYGNGDNNSPLIEALKENRQLWRSQHLQNYEFIYEEQCFCLAPANTPLKVSIKDDKIIQVVNLTSNQEIKDLNFPKTIEQLFDIIDQAIKGHADEILVTYDSSLGYPNTVAIDYQKILADEEVSYTVKNLIKLN